MEWAGACRLLVASYFSWNLGSSLQKTQVGLLRSLLHDILEQVPDLIPTLLPKLCRAASMEIKEEPTLLELKHGLLRLAQQTSISLRICLFVDGIDEFEKNHLDIADLFVNIPSTNCKVVVSSRPLPVCFDKFGSCSSLRLQDLTHDDIRSYTDQTIRSHRRWRELVEEEGKEAEMLIDSIAEKAEGVFLWVILAVDSLLEGLRNYDRLMDFRRRLEVLPPDLEDLYNHMLNQMQPLYLRQASQLLQIVLQHVELEADQPFSALQLSFAEEEDPAYPFSQAFVPLPTISRLSRYRAMEGRLRSRCCGLVEIWQDWQICEGDRISKSRVKFLHRTVVEFLRDPKVMKNLILHTNVVNFDPNIALAKGFLIDIKTQSHEQVWDLQGPAWQSMRRCLHFCRIGEYHVSQLSERILDELDNTMKALWRSTESVDLGLHLHERDSSRISQKLDWTALELRQPFWLGYFKGFELSQASMLVLAATAGLRQYVSYKLSLASSDVSFVQLQQAMRATLFSASRLVQEHSNPQTDYPLGASEESRSVSLETYKSIIDELLSAGAHPNDSLGIGGYSPWAFALISIEAMKPDTKTIEWCHILSLMLQSGANPNESIQEDGRYLVKHKTILSILTTKISNLSAGKRLRYLPSEHEAIQSMADLKTMLIERGAQNREWSEPKERKHQRDSTPAPWTSKSSSRRVITRKYDNSSSEQGLDTDSDSTPIRRGRSLGRVCTPSSAKDFEERVSTSSEETNESDATSIVSLRATDPILQEENFEPLIEHVERPFLLTAIVEQKPYKSNFEHEQRPSLAQVSSSGLEDSRNIRSPTDPVRTSDIQKPKMLSSFSSRFSVFWRHRARSRQ